MAIRGSLTLGIIAVTLLYVLGAFNYFGILKNSINIVNRCNSDINIELLFVAENDSTLVYSSTTNTYKELEKDWYGKDHIVVNIDGKEVAIHTFNDYKFKSWEKVTYGLNISCIEGQMILEWELDSRSLSNSHRNIIDSCKVRYKLPLQSSPNRPLNNYNSLTKSSYSYGRTQTTAAGTDCYGTIIWRIKQRLSVF